jgi:hypothetical protein
MGLRHLACHSVIDLNRTAIISPARCDLWKYSETQFNNNLGKNMTDFDVINLAVINLIMSLRLDCQQPFTGDTLLHRRNASFSALKI